MGDFFAEPLRFVFVACHALGGVGIAVTHFGFLPPPDGFLGTFELGGDLFKAVTAFSYKADGFLTKLGGIALGWSFVSM